jgi:2-amino-4-hydroxy-6-hydroxymethyldihydropteridine diphosphokinase
MTLRMAIGLGGSGHDADARLEAAMGGLVELGRVVGRSPRYANPAWGGVTRAPFVNACAIVETVLSPAGAMVVLRRLESDHGRLRATKNASRTLDLDLVWWTSPVASRSSVSTSLLVPEVPHPRLMDRSFVLVPLIDALLAAKMTIPTPLVAAAAKRRWCARLRPVSTS